MLAGCSREYNTLTEAMAIDFNESMHKMGTCVIHFYGTENEAMSFILWNHDRTCERVRRECLDNAKVCLWDINTGARSSAGKGWKPTFQGRCACSYNNKSIIFRKIED